MPAFDSLFLLTHWEFIWKWWGVPGLGPLASAAWACVGAGRGHIRVAQAAAIAAVHNRGSDNRPARGQGAADGAKAMVLAAVDGGRTTEGGLTATAHGMTAVRCRPPTQPFKSHHADATWIGLQTLWRMLGHTQLAESISHLQISHYSDRASREDIGAGACWLAQQAAVAGDHVGCWTRLRAACSVVPPPNTMVPRAALSA